MFPDGKGGHLPKDLESFERAALISVNQLLIEFAAQYKNTRTGEDLSPFIWRSYIVSIQRAFKHEWG